MDTFFFIRTSGGNKFYDFPQTQLIKYGAAMSFAFTEEMNELVFFCRCCSAANLWVLTLSHLSIIEGADILQT